MHFTEVIDIALKNNISLTVKNGELKVKAAKQAMSAEIVMLLKEHKAEIIAYLEACAHSDSVIAPVDEKIAKLSRSEASNGVLSFGQQRLWLIDQLQGGSPEYNMPRAYRLAGKFDIEAAQRAILQLLARHKVLQSVYKETESGIVQQCLDVSDFKINIIENTNLDGFDPEQNICELLKQEASRPFDLSCDLMVRVTLFKLDSNCEQSVLFFNIHHIACDGWSMEILFREFILLYRAQLTGVGADLPELSIQYVDYAHWQRQWLEGNRLQEQLAYWQANLADAPEQHGLKLKQSRQNVSSNVGKILSGTLDKVLSDKLRDVARRYQLTPFMLIHGALAIVLSRHSNTTDTVIGTYATNRAQAQLEPLIGFFVNTLALRVNTDHADLNSYFSHLRDVHLNAQKYQDVPFEKIIEALALPVADFSPVFQILLSTNTDFGHPSDTQHKHLNLDELTISALDSGVQQVKFDLEIHAAFSEQGTELSWLFNQELFDTHVVDQLNRHLCNVLNGLAQAGDSRLEEISMLDEREEQVLLLAHSQTQQNYRNTENLAALFTKQAKLTPEQTALCFEGQTLSYRQLNLRANQLAQYLVAQGLKPQMAVGVWCERSCEMVIAVLAVLKAGGCYVPLDTNAPLARCEQVLQEAQIQYLLTTDSAKYQSCALSDTVCAVLLDDEETLSELARQSNAEPAQGMLVNMNNLAYMLFTSGSTGVPKGVLIEHKAIVNFLHAMLEKLNTEVGIGKTWLAVTALTFDIAGLELFGPLLSGGTVVLASQNDVLDPERMTSLLSQYDIQCMQATPAVWQLLVDANWRGKRDLTVLSGGEALPLSLAKQLFDKCARLLNCYGPTEATIWSMVNEIDAASLDAGEIFLDGSLGNYQHYVFGPHHSLTPVGGVGELYIGGESLARGYLNRDELSRERFANHTVASKRVEKLYRTGDLVRVMANGSYSFIGRADHQVKIRGYRIELADIESQLEQIQPVRKALLLAHSDNARGNHLIAFIQLDGGEKQNVLDAIKERLAHVLPAYMLPSQLIPLSEWPLTSSGKVDRSSLLNRVKFNHREYIAPVSQVELALVQIWSQLLGIEVSEISQEDSFFELGGHSLLAVNLASAIKSEFALGDVKFNIQQVFEHPELKTLASHIELCQLKRQQAENESALARLESIEEGEF